MILNIINITVNLILDKIDCIREWDIFIHELATCNLLQLYNDKKQIFEDHPDGLWCQSPAHEARPEK